MVSGCQFKGFVQLVESELPVLPEEAEHPAIAVCKRQTVHVIDIPELGSGKLKSFERLVQAAEDHQVEARQKSRLDTGVKTEQCGEMPVSIGIIEREHSVEMLHGACGIAGPVQAYPHRAMGDHLRARIVAAFGRTQ